MRLKAVVVGAVLVACHGGGGNGGDGGLADDATTADAIDSTVDAAIDAPADGPSTGIGGPPLGTCTGSNATDWCWVLPRPQGDPISAVWASSATDVWAAAPQTVLHFDGAAWTASQTPLVPGVRLFAGSASNDVWAMTLSGVFHWDGTAWTRDRDAVVGAIAAFAANDVWTVDRDTAKHWDGSSWTAHPGPGFNVLAIGGDANNLIAVSSTGTIAKLLGTTWGIADATSHPGTDAVVIDPTHAVVIQDHDVLFWTSGTWTAHTPPLLAAPWVRVAARASNDVWITSPGARYHWNGTTWTEAVDANASFGVSLWEAPNGDLYTGDYDAQVKRWTGAVWTSLTQGPGVVRAVFGTANTDIFAIGSATNQSQPFAVQWNGSSWTSSTIPAGVHYVNAIWGSAPNNYWIGAGHYAGGDVVERQMLHWDGTQWTQFHLGTEDGVISSGIRLIRGFATNDVFAASPFALYHFDGTSWSPVTVPLPPSYRITDVFGASAADLYVAASNLLLHWDGATWTSKTAPISIYSGVEIAPTNLWLIGTNTSPGSTAELVNYDGSFFVTAGTNMCGELAIAVRGTDLYTCEGDPMYAGLGMVTKRSTTFGGTSTPIATPRSIWGSWISPDGRLYVPGMLVHAL
jgi:hypothetical protein